MKKRILLGIVLVAAVLALFVSCDTLLEVIVKPASSDSKSAGPKGSSDPLDGYVFAYVEGLTGGYHVAKELKPASDDTKGQAEVLDISMNEKRWAQVFTSHPAQESELEVGAVVLVQGSGFDDPDKDTLIDTTWDAYYVSDVSDLFKGEIKAGHLTVPVKHLRIPDTDIVTN